MRVLVLGAGSVGGYFGGRLAQAGHEVDFLVRDARKASLDRTGLDIESPFGNFHRQVRSTTTVGRGRHYEVVLLTCKAYDLDSAIEAIRPAVAQGAAVLPLLNGLAHMDRLNAEFGRSQVLGGFAKIVVSASPDDAIQHHGDWRYITFGEQDGTLSDRVRALEAAFPTDSVIAKAVPDILQGMWEKLVHLSTVASVACLMRANVGEIVRAPGGTALLNRVLELNAEIAARAGHRPPEAFLADYKRLFSDNSSTYAPSMLRDIERHHPVESDQIVGFMLDKARQFGVDCGLHELALMHLKAYEARRAAGRV